MMWQQPLDGSPWMTSPRRAAPNSGYRHCSGNSCKLDIRPSNAESIYLSLGPASSSIYLSLGLETDFNAHDEGDVGNRGRSYPVASIGPTLGANLIKFGLDPIRDDQADDQAVKKDGKNRVTLHLEQQNPSVFSNQNTG